MKITSVEKLDKNLLYTYADYSSWRFEQMVELIKGKIFILPLHQPAGTRAFS